MTKYVAGLLFDDERTRVALIHKTHGPAVLVGKWNAIGGKNQVRPAPLPPESSDAAMWREFLEEAGVQVSWTLFLRLKGRDWQVDFYHAFDTAKIEAVRTMEGEDVGVFALDNLPEIVPNLRWIIPMALGHEDDHVWVYEVREAETFAPRPSEVRA